jgi:biopolymer transport protein ExbD
MSALDPPPRRRISFMLTPLVDVMFLLLIFFMLSSQTAPYSLLEILAGGTPAQPGEQQAAPAPQPAATPQGKGDAVVTISRGYVRFNGERVEMSDLMAAIQRYKGLGYSSAVVFSSPAATVQDVVTVLETFQGSDFGDMRLVIQPGQAAP